MKRCIAFAGLVAATPAAAHHPLAGAPMETLAHGLLSGVGHPVLGFDHLFFVLAVGLAAGLARRPLTAPAAYVGAMLAGCGLVQAGFGLPAREAMIALSLLVLGGALASGRHIAAAPLLVLFAGFGLFHGAAFADALAGEEGGAGAAVLGGYLAGLGLVQYALAAAAGLVAGRAVGTTSAVPRLGGAAVAGVGAFLCLEALEGAAFAFLRLS